MFRSILTLFNYHYYPDSNFIAHSKRIPSYIFGKVPSFQIHTRSSQIQIHQAFFRFASEKSPSEIILLQMFEISCSSIFETILFECQKSF